MRAATAIGDGLRDRRAGGEIARESTARRRRGSAAVATPRARWNPRRGPRRDEIRLATRARERRDAFARATRSSRDRRARDLARDRPPRGRVRSERERRGDAPHLCVDYARASASRRVPVRAVSLIDVVTPNVFERSFVYALIVVEAWRLCRALAYDDAAEKALAALPASAPSIQSQPLKSDPHNLIQYRLEDRSGYGAVSSLLAWHSTGNFAR